MRAGTIRKRLWDEAVRLHLLATFAREVPRDDMPCREAVCERLREAAGAVEEALAEATDGVAEEGGDS